MRQTFFIIAYCSVLSVTCAYAQSPDKTQLSTSAGNRIETIQGWNSTTKGNVLSFEAPDGDLALAVVEVGSSPDAKTAAQRAWMSFRPNDRHPLELMTSRPARQGWDERVSISYETSPAEHIEHYASALRHGSAWTVLLVDGSQATAEKQYGAIALAQSSLHPADYVKESFAERSPHSLDPARVEAMRSFMEASIKTLEIPGASFALIDNGKVVYEGGVGVKKLGRNDPVDARTLFMAASNTKGMTTLLLSELVDKGELAWDEPVTRVYPSFRLGDAATTTDVKIKDLVCACTGLPRVDYEWIFNTPPTTPAIQTFTQIAGMQPTSKFGQVFQYNNQLAAAAGYIGGHILYPNLEVGAAYDRAMRKLIFDPLGMTDTTFSFDQALRGNVAYPHSDDIDGHTAVSSVDLDRVIVPFRPAGGAWSSAHDLIKYVALELSKGVLPSGKRLVSEKNIEARRARGVSTGENQWYGMGLWEDADAGVSVIHHGGVMPGYQSDIMFIPSTGVGAVIMTNSDRGSVLRNSFRRRLLEVLYDGKPEAEEDVAFRARTYRQSAIQNRSTITFPSDPSVIAKLSKTYINDDLGPMKVETTADGTRITTNSFSSLVATRKSSDGSIAIVPIDPGSISAEFVIGSVGGISTLTTRDGQHVYTFKAQSNDR